MKTEGSSYAYYKDNIAVKIEGKWILFSRLEGWVEDKNIEIWGGFVSEGYSLSDREENFGDLNQEQIDEITEEIMDEVGENGYYEKTKI